MDKITEAIAELVRRALPHCPHCGEKLDIHSDMKEAERSLRIGRKPYGGHPKYPEEAQHLERMKELRKQGLGYHEIAAVLNREGVPTRGGRGMWFGAVVSRILQAHEPVDNLKIVGAN